MTAMIIQGVLIAYVISQPSSAPDPDTPEPAPAPAPPAEPFSPTATGTIVSSAATPQRLAQRTLHQMFKSPPAPATPTRPTTTHQDVTRAYFWFKGHPAVRGIPHEEYNAGQKYTAKLFKDAPMEDLIAFVAAATNQADQKQEPHVPKEFKCFMRGYTRRAGVGKTASVHG